MQSQSKHEASSASLLAIAGLPTANERMERVPIRALSTVGV